MLELGVELVLELRPLFLLSRGQFLEGRAYEGEKGTGSRM